jgi:hypothetical protein
VRAGIALTDQPLGEERLQQRRERAHASMIRKFDEVIISLESVLGRPASGLITMFG